MLRHVNLQQQAAESIERRGDREQEDAKTGLESHQAPDAKTMGHLPAQLPPAADVKPCCNQ